MGKVSIGLRGWRFDEDEVFTPDGDLRPIDELPREARERLVRLTVVMGSPCDACWLIHGDRHIDECNVAEVVYGEPLHEVVLCSDHERDLVYWYQHEGGSQYRGEPAFEDAFHEWFDGGGRAPDAFEPIEHVDTDPDSVPTPDPTQPVESLEDELAEMDGDELAALDIDLDTLDP